MPRVKVPHPQIHHTPKDPSTPYAHEKQELEVETKSQESEKPYGNPVYDEANRPIPQEPFTPLDQENHIEHEEQESQQQ